MSEWLKWGWSGVYESDGSGFGHTDYFDNIVEDFGDILKDGWNGIARPIVDGMFEILGFEDEDIYATQVSTIRLVADEDIPTNSITLAVLRAIREDGPIIEHIQRIALTNPRNSLNHYTDYGENTYIHGLPTVKGCFSQANPDAVDTVITAIEGEAISIIALNTGIPNDVVWVKYYLQENESYTQDDQIIMFGGDPWLYNGFDIDGNGKFDVQLTRILSENGTHDGAADASALTDTTKSWTINEFVGHTITNTTDGSSGTVTANTATTVTATLSGGTENDWDVDDAYTITDVENTSIGYLIDPPINSLYYFCQYELDSDPTYIKFWVYLKSLETYPTLDITSSSGEYTDAAQLPIVPLREGFVSVNDTGDPNPAYATSKKILEIVNLDIDNLIDQVEGNTDIAEISNAFVVFALNIYTTTHAGQKSLRVLFNNLYDNQHVDKDTYDANPPEAEPIYNSIRMEEQSFNTAIVFNYITKENVTGTFGTGELDTYEIDFDILDNTATSEDPETGETIGGGINSTMTIRKMIGANTYEELIVYGMFQTVNITTEDGKIRAYLNELTDDTDIQQNFTIPLPYYLFTNDDLYPHESEAMIYESLTMILYASSHTHLEYYETASFLNFISIVIEFAAIIILAVSLGGATHISQALWLLAEQLLYQYALTIALQELLYLAGDNEILRALALIGYVAASVSVARDVGGMSNAEQLMLAVQASTQAMTVDLAYQSEQLATDIEAFTVSADERQKELEAAQELLAGSEGLELWEMATYLPLDPYEAPNDFYNRTIHTSNPGVISLDQIGLFHDNLLTLPELDIHSFDPVSPYG